jgi:glycosyltransferase involved in cell wall biosynthesis
MNPSTGGPCQGIRNSIPELEKLGMQNEVVCLDSAQSDYIAKDAFTIHALGQAKGPWAYSEALLPWLLQHISSYDIVIVHGLWQYHGYAVRKAISQLRKRNMVLPKVYVMPHGMLDPYFQKAEGRKLKALRNIVYWKLIESKLVNQADGILFTCEAELLLAREPFKPYLPKKELNIGYGIQAPPVYNDRMNEAFTKLCPVVKDQPYLLFLSRIHEKKGVDLLVKAYLHLQHQGMDLPHLVIAGPGLDTDFGMHVAEIAKDSNTIHFPGMLTGAAKWGAFYGCDAFVLPSHQENFGIAVAEALACAKPVLISNQVNIWREIHHGNAGLVSDDTEAGTMQLLENWLKLSIVEQKQMGENANAAYMQYYAVEKAAQQMKDILNPT